MGLFDDVVFNSKDKKFEILSIPNKSFTGPARLSLKRLNDIINK